MLLQVKKKKKLQIRILYFFFNNCNNYNFFLTFLFLKNSSYLGFPYLVDTGVSG